jgi:general secretion pathway protein D
MYAQHMDMARKYRNALELDRALTELDNALGYQPTSAEALSLRNEVLRLLGDRAGETRTILDDKYAAAEVKKEEQKVTVRRLIAEGKQQMDAKSYDQASDSLERALFVVSSAKLSPLGTDDELTKLGSEAEAAKKELERRIAQAEADQERADTARALKQVAEIEEKQLMEARERRARMLNSAIDAFNREEFELAETYAAEVLREEPDNTVARDLLENSQKARHTVIGEKYLRDLKESFRRWQVDIEQTKIPNSKILTWPSQSFWDRISQLRAMRDVGGGGRQMSPEELAVQNTLATRTITLRFEQVAFPDVVNYLSGSCGVNFVIDPRAREELDAAEVTIEADGVTVKDGMDLILMQVSAEGAIVYEITGNVVRFLKKENVKKDMTLRIHPVADLTLGLTDFIPPQITLVGVDEDSEAPLFGGQAEEAPQPYGTIEELQELVRTSVAPAAWEEGAQIQPQGKNLVVYAPPEVQNQVAQFLDDLRSFAGIVVTIESRFLTVSDNFLRDLGVDIRGLGGSNSSTLAVLDDVTNGLVNNASAGFDNGGPGVQGGGAALSPSSGIYFNDGTDGDFRGRTENILINPLGQVLSALGGGTFEITYLDDIALSVVVRATEKTARARELTAPSLTVYNTQRANITVVNQISFIEDFDVEVAQTAFIADPIVGVIQDGLVLDVQPTVSHDRKYITMQLKPTVARLERPIPTFTTSLGAFTTPVTIQIPKLRVEKAATNVRVPDGGTILLGGLKGINLKDLKAETPWISSVPFASFFLGRRGSAKEMSNLMVIVKATISDLNEQEKAIRR